MNWGYIGSVVIAAGLIFMGSDEPLESNIYYLFSAMVLIVRAEVQRVRDEIKEKK